MIFCTIISCNLLQRLFSAQLFLLNYFLHNSFQETSNGNLQISLFLPCYIFSSKEGLFKGTVSWDLWVLVFSSNSFSWSHKRYGTYSGTISIFAQYSRRYLNIKSSPQYTADSIKISYLSYYVIKMCIPGLFLKNLSFKSCGCLNFF